MKCRHVERLLSDDREGRLSQRKVDAIAAHLQDCRSCRRFREDLAIVEAELRGYRDPLPPSGIERRAVSLWMAERERESLRPGRLLIPLVRMHAARRSPLHTVVLMAILLLAVLGLELPASGYRAAGPVRLSQAQRGLDLAHAEKV